MRLTSLIDLVRLLRQQWLTPEDLAELQRRKLVAMVRHAYEKVPYYRELFDSVGARPADIRTAGDLQGIPITTRRRMQSLPRDAVVARGTNLRGCKKVLTSGSCGVPLGVLLRRRDSSFYDMVWARAAFACGRRLRDRVASARVVTEPPPMHWFQRLGVWRTDNIPLVQSAEDQVREMLRRRPDIVRADPHQLVGEARAILRERIEGLRPRLIFSRGSVLDGAARELLRRAFGAEVFDFYGATELGCIAWECPQHDGYHINADTVLVEFVAQDRPAAPGEMGRVVCTGLHAFAMPFIRYDLGDVAVPDGRRCACGRGLPLMHGITGKTDDFFVARDGSVRSPSVIIGRVKRLPSISQFHLTQRRDRRILARIVATDGFGDDTRAQVVSTLQQIMADGSEVEVEVVPEIPADPAKKVRSVVSEVPLPF
jgi:phenylacetate-CoA ligase